MDEQRITPLFAHDEPGGRCDALQVAELINCPGFPSEKAVTLVRRLARDRLIEVRGHRNNTNLFAPADAAAALVFRAVFDCGFADAEITQAVHHALYAWQPGQHRQQHHPITHAFGTYVLGRDHSNDWCFEIRILRDRLGKRVVRAFCYRMDDRPVIHNDNLWPVATTSFLLGPLLLPLYVRVTQCLKRRKTCAAR
jgi:hypothetical protein